MLFLTKRMTQRDWSAKFQCGDMGLEDSSLYQQLSLNIGSLLRESIVGGPGRTCAQLAKEIDALKYMACVRPKVMRKLKKFDF